MVKKRIGFSGALYNGNKKLFEVRSATEEETLRDLFSKCENKYGIQLFDKKSRSFNDNKK